MDENTPIHINEELCWNIDVVLGEASPAGERSTLRAKIHTNQEEYYKKRKIVAFAHTWRTQDFVPMQPSILISARRLVVILSTLVYPMFGKVLRPIRGERQRVALSATRMGTNLIVSLTRISTKNLWACAYVSSMLHFVCR